MPMPGAAGRPAISPEFLRLLMSQMPQGAGAGTFDRNNQPGQTQGIDSADDRQWAAAHPQGYGSVDAPGAFGNNRDVFMSEHTGYSGGFYSPTTGRYDAPGDAYTPAPSAGGYDPMAGMPTGGSSDGIYGSQSDFTSPYSSGDSMGNLPTGGDSGQQQDSGQNEWQSFLEALAATEPYQEYRG